MRESLSIISHWAGTTQFVITNSDVSALLWEIFELACAVGEADDLVTRAAGEKRWEAMQTRDTLLKQLRERRVRLIKILCIDVCRCQLERSVCQ